PSSIGASKRHAQRDEQRQKSGHAEGRPSADDLCQPSRQVADTDAARECGHATEGLDLTYFLIGLRHFHAQCVRDHVLDHEADGDQERRDQVPGPGGDAARHRHKARHARCASKQQVGDATASQNRVDVGGDACNHLHGPRKPQPERDSGDFGGCQFERVFLEKDVRHRGDSAGSITEVREKDRAPGPTITAQKGTPHLSILLHVMSELAGPAESYSHKALIMRSCKYGKAFATPKSWHMTLFRRASIFWQSRRFWGKARPRIALALGGGGVIGGMYEVGALAALEERLNGEGRGFDVYVGCSAGSVVASLLANGVRARELYRILDQDMDDPLNFRRGAVFAPDSFRRAASRFGRMVWAVGKNAVTAVRGSIPDMLARAERDLPPGFFSLVALERFMRHGFESKGLTNAFPSLPRTLLIPAIDLDRAERVVFGQGGLCEVPISQAVAAS